MTATLERTERMAQLEERLEKHYNREEIEAIMPKLEEIDRLRDEKNAVILAHLYQIPAIQLIADIAGDSLALAKATERIKDKSLVVSSTVHFMAEMVKLLSPDKKVVVPDLEASCSIAEGITGEAIRKIRQAFPHSAIVGYINTTAEAKAEMDATCTSANALRVVKNIKGNPLIMLPDYFFSLNMLSEADARDSTREYLAYKGIEDNNFVLENVRNKTLFRIRTDHLSLPMLAKGTCVVHEQFTPEKVKFEKNRYKVDKVIAHPEVKPDVAALADMVGGTQKMIEYVGQTHANKFLVISECDLIAPLKEAYPEKEFVTPCTLCPYMKKNTLDKLINSIRNEVYEIKLHPKNAEGAKRSLERMFELDHD